MNLSNDQKAALYNEGLRRYNLIDEQIRQIKSKSFEVSDADMKKIGELEEKKKFIFNQTQKLHNR
jgi:glutamate mutase epsilon subunit